MAVRRCRVALLSGVPVAVADIASFGRVQSKIEFARLLDEIGLPQPRWRLVADAERPDGAAVSRTG